MRTNNVKRVYYDCIFSVIEVQDKETCQPTTSKRQSNTQKSQSDTPKTQLDSQACQSTTHITPKKQITSKASQPPTTGYVNDTIHFPTSSSFVNKCCLLITYTNRLDPDHARKNVVPHLDPNRFDTAYEFDDTTA